MIRVLFLLFSMLIYASVQAECYYSQYELKLMVSLSSGDKLVAYQTLSACAIEENALMNDSLLFRTLLAAAEGDSISFFEYQMVYAYCPPGMVECQPEEKSEVICLLQALPFDKGEIEGITLADYKHVSALEAISTDLQLADTILCSLQAIESFPVDGYLCSHSVFIYQYSDELNRFLTPLKELQAKLESDEMVLNYENGDDFDEQVWRMIDLLNSKEGILVVSSCSD